MSNIEINNEAIDPNKVRNITNFQIRYFNSLINVKRKEEVKPLPRPLQKLTNTVKFYLHKYLKIDHFVFSKYHIYYLFINQAIGSSKQKKIEDYILFYIYSRRKYYYYHQNTK